MIITYRCPEDSFIEWVRKLSPKWLLLYTTTSEHDPNSYTYTYLTEQGKVVSIEFKDWKVVLCTT